MDYLGEIAGIATSISWTLCSLGFALAGRRIGAVAVNQIRIFIAVAILFAVHAATQGSLWPSVSTDQLGWLALSGLLGLAIGDSFYFHSISVLGPRIGSVLMATAPVMCALLAWPVLGERLSGTGWLGMGLTILGVVLVVVDPRGEPTWEGDGPRGSRGFAVVAGLLGALGQASGLVFSKLGMAADEAHAALEPLPATVVRMAAGAAGVLLLALWGGQLRRTVSAVRDGRAMSATMFGVLFGPTLGVWMSMVAVKHADAGVAATLMALPPVFMIPVARVAYGARSGRRAIAGTLLAVAGTAVLFLR